MRLNYFLLELFAVRFSFLTHFKGSFYEIPGISKATFYQWRKKYAGMEASHLKRLKELEEENRMLKQMYADMSLDNTMLKDVLSKKW